MKRISSPSFLALLAGAVLPAQAQFKDYQFFKLPSSHVLNDVTFDGTRFWAVGESNGVRRSGSTVDSPEQRGLIFESISLTGASNRLTSVVSLDAGFLAIGGGTGLTNDSVGALYRLSTNFAATTAAVTIVPESSSLNLGQVTDLTRAGTNLIRFGNRFAAGRYPLANLLGSSPTNSQRVADISPFFEDYQQGVLIGSNLILAGQYRGEPQPRGAVSLSRDFGLSNAPAAGVTLFDTSEASRIQTVGSDGQHLYISGPSNFVAVLEGAVTRSSLPAATNANWLKATNASAGLNAIVPHGGILFVAAADGIHQRAPGAAFLTTKAKPSNLQDPVRALSVATAGELEDIVVGTSGTNLIVGGPVPEKAVVGGYRLHFIDSDLSNVVNISNLITAATTSQKSVAYDVYKIVGGVNVGKMVTVGPRRSSVATSFNLVDLGTTGFNYGTNVFEIAARDVRTGIEAERIQFTAFRWPNPQAAHLGRQQGTDEPRHYFQLGADYRTSPVPSFLFVTNQVIDNGRGQSLVVPVASANWFKLNTPLGQSIANANVVVLSNSLAGHKLVASDVDRINLSELPVLDPGVHTFAVQSVAKFPVPPGSGLTNSYATNVTLFNVVVLRRPERPSLDWTTWETGACAGTVDSKLLPSGNGAWVEALEFPNNAIANDDPRLAANVSRANWPSFAANALGASLPVSQNPANVTSLSVKVQSVSVNRDGVDAVSSNVTEITLVSRPVPQAPAISLTGVRVGTGGVPAPRDFEIPTGAAQRIQVGEGVVGNVVAQPAGAIETRLNYTVVTWTVAASEGATASQTGADLLFATPFNLATPVRGLYRLTARSSNSYTNLLVTAHANGVPTSSSKVVQTCTSPTLTTLEIEVRQRPPVPAVTVAGVGVYNNGTIQYLNPGDSAEVVIGQDANRPEYRVTPGEISGIGGTKWESADWYLVTPGGGQVSLTNNSATVTPPVSLTTATLGGGPARFQILAYARSLDGSVGLVPRTLTLIVTPPPAAPSLLAGNFSTYNGSTLVPQTDVEVANLSVFTIAGSLPGIADHRPTYSMIAQGTNALVADWYLKGKTEPLALGVATFRPTTTDAPVGTNDFFAVARSTQGSVSALGTSFRLIVTGKPAAPAVTANDVRQFNAAGNFISVSDLPVVPTIRIADEVRNLVTEVGLRLRPEFLAAPEANSNGADWYLVQGESRKLVATNTPTYQPTAEQSVLGTNRYLVVTRSLQGAESDPTLFELIVTGPSPAPNLSVGEFYRHEGGVLTLQGQAALPVGGVTTVAATLADHPNVRPVYRATGAVAANAFDWYQITGSTTNQVAKQTSQFVPTIGQTPVGTHTFVAVARSTEGSISPVTTFTLVVTPVPVAPAIAAGDFLLPNAQGVPTLQNGVTVIPGTPLVIGDNAGDAARLRPQFSLAPLGANVVAADWYRDGAAAPVATNTLVFRPSSESTPVGSHLFRAVARSAEGASSAPSSFTLTVTGKPSEPEISGQIPKVSADGLTLSNSDGDVPVNPGDVIALGTKAAQQFAADGSFRFSVNDGANLKAAFTRWSLDGTVVATNQSFVPNLTTATTHAVSLTPYSQDGTAGAAVEFAIVVTPAPSAPSVTPLLATRASCDTGTNFTATLGADVRSIVWTTGPTSESARLKVDSQYGTANDLPALPTPYRYYAWAVSTNGDWSPASTEVNLTVVPAPPVAQFEGGASRLIGEDASAYPEITVSNAGENQVDWYIGNVKKQSGPSFTPTISDLPTSSTNSLSSTNKAILTNVVTVVLSRENCSTTNTLTFVVIAPWLDASFSKQGDGIVSLHLNAVGDLSARSATLYTTNDVALLASGAGLEASAAAFPVINLTNVVSTNNGVTRYYLHSITNPLESPGFFRLKLNP